MPSRPVLNPLTIQSGDELPEFSVAMERETYFEYNGATSEINPLHFDRPYAQSLGYRDIVVAGLYTYAFIPRMIEEWLGDAGSIRKLRVAYRNPVYIDETILLRTKVVKTDSEDGRRLIDLEIVVRDREGGERIQATATVACP